jgi:hypothetical protein
VEKVFVERLDPRDMDDPRDAFFVDSGLTYDGRNRAGTATLTGGTTWDVGESLNLATSEAVWTGASDEGDQVLLILETTSTLTGEPVTTSADVKVEVIDFVDASNVTVRPLEPIPAAFQGVAIERWELLRDTVVGLDHLEGRTVSVLADGNVQGQQLVASGVITLDHPAAVVHVGLPYRSLIESLDINVPGAETVRAQPKLITKVSLLVKQTRGLRSGPDEGLLDDFKVREFEDYDDPVRLVDGLLEVNTIGSWDKNGRFVVIQEDPLPATILSLIPDVSISGTG